MPGDFLGLRSVLLRTSDHSFEPIVDIEAAEVLTSDLLEAFAQTRRLATAILWAASRDEAMVVEHHKLRAAGPSTGPLVEPFRKADWIDVSLGLLRFGLSGEFIGQVKARFPNAGFHKLLVRATGSQIMRDPLHPAPMMRW